MKQDRTRDENMPSRSSDREPAEGSRDNVMNRGDEDRSSRNSGGITNRPLDEEQDEQDQLPERGRSQSER